MTKSMRETEEAEVTTYPLYILQLGEQAQVVFPEGKQDLGHTEFWERTASFIVARYYKISQEWLVNLPYSQRRARVVGQRVYYGGKPDAGLLQLIRDAAEDQDFVFCRDEHEQRLRHDVRQFRRLLKRQAAGG